MECKRNAEGYSRRADGNSPMIPTTETAPENRRGQGEHGGELQSQDLTAHAAHQGWDIIEMYQDVMSGAKASRPALNSLMTGPPASRLGGLLKYYCRAA